MSNFTNTTLDRAITPRTDLATIEPRLNLASNTSAFTTQATGATQTPDFSALIALIQQLITLLQGLVDQQPEGKPEPEPVPEPNQLEATNNFQLNNDERNRLLEVVDRVGVQDVGFGIQDTNNDHVISAGDQVIGGGVFTTESWVEHTLTEADVEALNSNAPLRIELPNTMDEALEQIVPTTNNQWNTVTDTNHDGVLSSGDQVTTRDNNTGDVIATHTLSESDVELLLNN